MHFRWFFWYWKLVMFKPLNPDLVLVVTRPPSDEQWHHPGLSPQQSSSEHRWALHKILLLAFATSALFKHHDQHCRSTKTTAALTPIRQIGHLFRLLKRLQRCSSEQFWLTCNKRIKMMNTDLNLLYCNRVLRIVKFTHLLKFNCNFKEPEYNPLFMVIFNQ